MNALTILALVVGIDASDSAAADVVGPATLIVAPLVGMTFAVTGFQGWRRHRQSRALAA